MSILNSRVLLVQVKEFHWNYWESDSIKHKSYRHFS